LDSDRQTVKRHIVFSPFLLISLDSLNPNTTTVRLDARMLFHKR
jgi:hypothetical protein